MYNIPMKSKALLSCFVVIACVCAGCATFSETAERYRESLHDIQEGRTYFAVVNLGAILKQAPDSPYAPSCAFALGEYYFDNADYFNCIKMLSGYIHDYPKDNGVVFAKLIIYKIIENYKEKDSLSQQQENLIKQIRKELFSQPLFLIFYDRRIPRSYKSLFNNSYLVYDYVDKIKVFRNEKIFLELTP